MAFVLRPERKIHRELRRLVKRQIQQARAALDGEPTDTAVHEARKRIKKARAILRLLD